jgi:hypothetical protein
MCSSFDPSWNDGNPHSDLGAFLDSTEAPEESADAVDKAPSRPATDALNRDLFNRNIKAAIAHPDDYLSILEEISELAEQESQGDVATDTEEVDP